MRNFYKSIAVVAIIITSISVQILNAEIKEFKKTFKNGKTFIESKRIPNLTKAFLVSTYYDNDRIMKTEEWRNGKRNGLTKVYNRDGSILKDIKFFDNYVLDYKAYKNGRIETQISENRRIIVNKGRQLNIRWDKYYELWGGNFLATFDSKGLINYLLNFVVPEEATEILSDITDFFDSKPGAGQNGMDDISTCGGSSSVFKDNNIDLRQAGSTNSSKGTSSRFGNTGSSKPSASTTMNNTVVDMMQSCADNYRNSSGVSGGVGGFNQSRNNDISKANAALDNTIQGCRSRANSGNSLVAMNPALPISVQLSEVGAVANGFDAGVAAVTEITGLGAGAATETGAIIATETTKDVALAAMEGSAVRTAAGTAVRGFITAGTSTAIAGVTFAAVVGWAIGTAINNSAVGEAITGAVAKLQEDNDADYQAAVAAADAAQKAAEADKKKETAEPASSGTPPAASSPVSTPAPDDVGNGDACERAERFKNYCNNTGWRDMRCEEYIRMVKKCTGDIRVINVGPEGGSVMDVGCAKGGDPAAVRELDCKKKGMIARPGGNEPGGMCANKKVEPVMHGPDQRVINPTRGDFSIPSVSGVNIGLADDGDETSLLSSTKPTLVIFADPDCGFCSEMTKTLTSKSVSTSLSAYDVKFVDVNMSPKLAQKFGVEIVPSYFVAKSGKKSTLQAGAMDEKSMNNYLNDNKNGPSSSK